VTKVTRAIPVRQDLRDYKVLKGYRASREHRENLGQWDLRAHKAKQALRDHLGFKGPTAIKVTPARWARRGLKVRRGHKDWKDLKGHPVIHPGS